MRVSVVGCGGISRCHFAALKEIDGVEIVGVADIKKDRADKAAEICGCRAYYDYEEMLRSEKPDCVHICTPHYLHVSMAVTAMSMGINVLCEKPCAVSMQELDKLRLAQSVSGAQYGVCFQNRYNASVQTVKKILDSAVYGKVKGVKAGVYWCRNENYYSDDWHGTADKECGGVLINQAIHTLDLLGYLLNKKVLRATGHTFNDHLKGKIEVEDTATARFEYEDGTVAMLFATTGFSTDAPITIDLFCEKAQIKIEGDSVYIISDGEIKPLHIAEDTEFVGKSYWGRGHYSLTADFYDCLKNGKKFEIDAYEGGRAVEEMLAVYSSAEIGETVIIK